MKVITLWEPWATFVAMKWKTIETRTHQRFKGLTGQRIAIHAAMKFDKTIPWGKYFRPNISMSQVDNIIKSACLNKGAIVCTAMVTDVRWAPNVNFVEREEWNLKAMCEVAGKFCLFLDDIELFKPTIPFRGRQGIFEVPDHIIKEGA